MNGWRTALLVLLAVALAPSALVAGGPVCSGSTWHLVSWPETDPLWELCWRRPADSSGLDGSGLEIRDVFYSGRQVLKRGHVPMLNVDYDGGLCFRDWAFEEREIRADNEIFPGYYEPTFPAETVCDNATVDMPVGDCPWDGPGPCVLGVAAEKLADRLVLTTQARASWYRYSIRWIFHQDGRFEPRFGFATWNETQSAETHRHHAYWRLDFDIDGAGDDFVNENGTTIFAIEDDRTWSAGGGTFWEVQDANTGRGYRLTPGAQDLLLPADAHSQTDLMVTAYRDGEYGDGSAGCEVAVSDLVNGEPVSNTDVVLYYRNGVEDVPGQDIFRCKTGGPLLTPIGDWSAPLFGDGFESGDTSRWSGGT